MAVEDQDDLLPLALADQPVQEVDEHRGHEFLPEHPELQAPLDQLTRQRPGPQEPRQLELVGVLLTNRLGDLRLLPWQQSRLLTRTSATRACPQRLLTSEPLRPHPLAHRLAAHIDQS